MGRELGGAEGGETGVGVYCTNEESISIFFLLF